MRFAIFALLAISVGCSSGGSGGSHHHHGGSHGTGPQGTRLLALSGKPVKNRLIFDSADPSNRAVTAADGSFSLPRPPGGPLRTDVSSSEPIITRAPRSAWSRLLEGEALADDTATVLFVREASVPSSTPIILGFEQPATVARAPGSYTQSDETVELVATSPGEEYVLNYTDPNGATRSIVRAADGHDLSNVPFLFGVPDPGGIGDLNEDGKPDFFDGTRICLGDGGGGFTVLSTLPGQNMYALVDLNGDHHLDLVSGIVGVDPSDILLRLGNGDGTFKAPTVFTTIANPSAIAAANFNGDGSPDVLIGGATGATIFFGPDGATSTAITTQATGSVAFADVDGDGVPEALAFHAHTITVAHRGGAIETIGIPNSTSTGAVRVRDLNGDGIADVVMGSGATHMNIGFGVRGVGLADWANYSVAAGSLALGDFDGDGVVDVALPGGGDLMKGR